MRVINYGKQYIRSITIKGDRLPFQIIDDENGVVLGYDSTSLSSRIYIHEDTLYDFYEALAEIIRVNYPVTAKLLGIDFEIDEDN